LGAYPYPDTKCHSYRSDNNDFATVVRASSGIKLLHEADPALEKAHKILGAASRICFLGFSYHPLNVKRLSIDTSSAGSKQILGTCHGLIGYELGAAEVRIQDAIGRKAKLDRQDNLETLRAYQILG